MKAFYDREFARVDYAKKRAEILLLAQEKAELDKAEAERQKEVQVHLPLRYRGHLDPSCSFNNKRRLRQQPPVCSQ